MRFEIEFTDNALQDYRRLDAHWRALVKDAVEVHWRYEPSKESKSRIKRLRELKWPEYRLRIDEFRVFYQIENSSVQILAIVAKENAEEWLQTFGK